MKISAIILTKDVEDLIDDCLESIGWVDEIVVIDGGSEDKTLEKVKKHKNTKVYESEGNFSEKRNLGAEKAKGE
ncbi:MAG: glycosyltransferase [Saprospiraceae bacterium]|nr:glycosyltransferase [Saprospiraceae bacterium]